MSLKEKTIHGLKWSFIDNFISLGLTFIIGIILARLLSPREFGLVGMLTIFITLGTTFVNGGFSQALIRKQNCTKEDYSTIFLFNFGVGLLFYILLYFSAGAISRFFNEPVLKLMIRVLGIGILINAFSLIQTTRLTQQINFKLQAKISLIATIFSGVVGISMAYVGYGAWSLIIKTLASYILSSVFLWVWNSWRPVWAFSISSLKQLFSFGSKILVSNLLGAIYGNVYYLVIGKYFNASQLGYYTRADQFQSLPSSTLQGIVSRVSYPVLSTIQDDTPRLKMAYKKLIRSTMLITFVLMMGMAAAARPMVLTLIGEKWEPCVIYLQILCFVGMFYPLHALNLEMLQVQGRSDLYLRLEIIKKVIAIPVIIICVLFGIKAMLLSMVLNTLFAYYLNSYWSGQLINYSFLEQIKDILPSFLLALLISSIMFLESLFIFLSSPILLAIQLISGVAATIGVCELLKLKDYLYLKEIVLRKSFNIK